jgi:hypothetical protein
MRHLLALLSLGAALLLAPTAWAADPATPDEAKAMAIKAAAYLTSVGPEKAFPEFNAHDGPWHDRELYVIVEDGKAMMMVNGAIPGMVGKPMIDLKDVNGKAFNREMIEIKDQGWVNFTWRNPLTKAMQPKTVYIVRVGDYVVGVGAYVN